MLDTTTRVQIEIDAARLARIDRWWDDPKFESQSYGALQFHNGGTPGCDNDGGSSANEVDELVGWLACQISSSS